MEAGLDASGGEMEAACRGFQGPLGNLWLFCRMSCAGRPGATVLRGGV